MTELMMKAMREGKIDFVRLLISECIDIQKFQLNNRDKLYASKYVRFLSAVYLIFHLTKYLKLGYKFLYNITLERIKIFLQNLNNRCLKW